MMTVSSLNNKTLQVRSRKLTYIIKITKLILFVIFTLFVTFVTTATSSIVFIILNCYVLGNF